MTMNHYITKYTDENKTKKAVSWIQINLFGRAFCFFKREINI